MHTCQRNIFIADVKSPGRNQSFTDEQVKDALALRDQGCTWKEAAASIGISIGRLKIRQAMLRGRPYPSSGPSYQTLRKYKLTPTAYARLIEEQDGKCAICASDAYRLVIDHSDLTAEPRGLLCAPCNGALGWVEKTLTLGNDAWLERALRYLEERGPQGPGSAKPIGRPPLYSEEQIREAIEALDRGVSWLWAAKLVVTDGKQISLTNLKKRVREMRAKETGNA